MSLEPDRVERLRKKLYEKAKQEPDFRFYSLYDKVCWAETLDRAYRQAKANAGAAGVDGVQFEDIESYGVDRWLAELRQELLEETYHPQPVRRVLIPKPGGGERPLGIPTIRDRVVQTAAAEVPGTYSSTLLWEFLIGALLGHSRAGVTGRYVIPAQDPVRQVAERVAAIIAEALQLDSRELAKVLPMTSREAGEGAK